MEARICMLQEGVENMEMEKRSSTELNQVVHSHSLFVGPFRVDNLMEKEVQVTMQ